MEELYSELNFFLKKIANNKELEINEITNLEEIEMLDSDLASFYIELINQNSNILIPKNDYRILDFSDVVLDWDKPQTKENLNYVYGGFKLTGVMDALLAESNFWKIYKNDSRVELKKLCAFQMSGHGYDGTFGCFYKECDSWPLKIFFYDNGDCYETDLSFEEYIKGMFASYAIQNWQYFYINVPKNHQKLSEIIDKMIFSYENLKKIFPEGDFNFHKLRLEDLGA